MLNKEELNLVYEHAYLPEHVPTYVEAVSGAEAYLEGGYLCFSRGNHLTFVGYPLGGERGDAPRAYESACEHFRPGTVAIIAPEIWLPAETYGKQVEDSYYRLMLPSATPSPEVAYMVRRASRELRVREGKFGKEHHRLVEDFLSKRQLTEAQIHIFKHIGPYTERSTSVRLLEARKGDVLVAFTIADMGSVGYAFYLFNFRSVADRVPGASDLLFDVMVRLAESEGKAAINLGLGINSGNRHFKEKWGGTPFLDYNAAFINRKPFEMGRLMHKL